MPGMKDESLPKNWMNVAIIEKAARALQERRVSRHASMRKVLHEERFMSAEKL
jgi:hypothetical protein